MQLCSSAIKYEIHKMQLGSSRLKGILCRQTLCQPNPSSQTVRKVRRAISYVALIVPRGELPQCAVEKPNYLEEHIR